MNRFAKGDKVRARPGVPCGSQEPGTVVQEPGDEHPAEWAMKEPFYLVQWLTNARGGSTIAWLRESDLERHLGCELSASRDAVCSDRPGGGTLRQFPQSLPANLLTV